MIAKLPFKPILLGGAYLPTFLLWLAPWFGPASFDITLLLGFAFVAFSAQLLWVWQALVYVTSFSRSDEEVEAASRRVNLIKFLLPVLLLLGALSSYLLFSSGNLERLFPSDSFESNISSVTTGIGFLVWIVAHWIVATAVCETERMRGTRNSSVFVTFVQLSYLLFGVTHIRRRLESLAESESLSVPASTH